MLEPYSRPWWIRRWILEVLGGFAACAALVGLAVMEPRWLSMEARNELAVGAIAGPPFVLAIIDMQSLEPAWGDRVPGAVRVLALVILVVVQCALLVLVAVLLKT